MNASIRIAAALLACMPLMACTKPAPPAPPAPPTSPSSTPSTALGRMVEKGIDEAREELATENIDLNGHIRFRDGDKHGVSIDSSSPQGDTRPRGEITPQGELLIDGKPVKVTPEQHALLVDYRQHVIGVAETGMQIGIQAADLASKAVGEAIGAVFSGKGEKEIEQRMEAEGEKIEAQARKLCNLLPAMLRTQQALAASLPEFKPYATMTQEDIDECREDVHTSQQQTTAKQ